MAKYLNKNNITEEKIKKALMSKYSLGNARSISVTDICKEAGINRCTFYLHYDSVEDLLDSIRREILTEITNRSKHLSRHNIYEAQRGGKKENLALVGVLSYFLEIRDYMLPLLTPGRDDIFREDLRASISELFYSAFAYYGQSFGTEQEYVIRFITSGIVDDIYFWLMHQDKSVEEMSDFFMRTTDLFPVVKMNFSKRDRNY